VTIRPAAPTGLITASVSFTHQIVPMKYCQCTGWPKSDPPTFYHYDVNSTKYEKNSIVMTYHTIPTAFTTFSHQLRHLSTHCVIVRPTLSLSVNISCLKCRLLTGACLVTCKHYINFLLYNLYFVSFHFCVVLVLFTHV